MLRGFRLVCILPKNLCSEFDVFRGRFPAYESIVCVRWCFFNVFFLPWWPREEPMSAQSLPKWWTVYGLRNEFWLFLFHWLERWKMWRYVPNTLSSNLFRDCFQFNPFSVKKYCERPSESKFIGSNKHCLRKRTKQAFLSQNIGFTRAK